MGERGLHNQQVKRLDMTGPKPGRLACAQWAGRLIPLEETVNYKDIFLEIRHFPFCCGLTYAETIVGHYHQQ